MAYVTDQIESVARMRKLSKDIEITSQYLDNLYFEEKCVNHRISFRKSDRNGNRKCFLNTPDHLNGNESCFQSNAHLFNLW